jgi:hypothetical protein
MLSERLDRCRCEPTPRGPPWDDGSDPGMCAYCEEMAWRTEHGQHDEDFEAMIDGRSELTAEERFAALVAMGEPDDSLMLGGRGGGERDPDLEFY